MKYTTLTRAIGTFAIAAALSAHPLLPTLKGDQLEEEYELSISHVHRELTVPHAHFDGRPPRKPASRPHALTLLGDRYHEPEYIEAGLRRVFEETGVFPHFTVDARALSADNLAHVQLLVILRDGMIWPDGADKPRKIWMTPQQELAVVEFVERGGALLNLHNSMGLYPKDGAYLRLVGGRYIGHGPLERFRDEDV